MIRRAARTLLSRLAAALDAMPWRQAERRHALACRLYRVMLAARAGRG